MANHFRYTTRISWTPPLGNSNGCHLQRLTNSIKIPKRAAAAGNVSALWRRRSIRKCNVNGILFARAAAMRFMARKETLSRPFLTHSREISLLRAHPKVFFNCATSEQRATAAAAAEMLKSEMHRRKLMKRPMETMEERAAARCWCTYARGTMNHNEQ
jgi:hypothetical protein